MASGVEANSPRHVLVLSGRRHSLRAATTALREKIDLAHTRCDAWSTLGAGGTR